MRFGAAALFKWKPGQSPDSYASSPWLHHGDLLVMDGRCQDEYLHCTDPMKGGEQANITFQWIRNHVFRCPLAAGVVCCLPTCVKGSYVPTNAGFLLPGFWLLVSLLVLVRWGFFRVIALVSINLGLQRCSFSCTRLVGGDRRGFGCCGAVQNSGGRDPGRISCVVCLGWHFTVLDALVWNRLPSLLNCHTHLVLWLRRAHRGNNGQRQHETSFLPFFGFLVSRITPRRFWSKILWYQWIGRAGLGLARTIMISRCLILEGFLTHGDCALETDADFLALVEHRLVLARARSEAKRLKSAGLWSIWAPASQESGHVGHAGVGVVSLRGATPLSLRSLATTASSEFYAQGRVVMCHLLVAKGRKVHRVVIYSFRKPLLILRS